MNRRLALGLVLLGTAPLFAAVETAESLITNGAFEKDRTGHGWPDGWGSPAPGNGKSWESEDGHRFMRLKARGQLQMLCRAVKLNPGKARDVTFTIHYRTPGFTEGRALVLIKDQAGRLLGDESLDLSSGAREWTDAAKQFNLPADTAQLIIVAGLLPAGTGSLDISSVTLIPSATQDLPARPLREEETLPVNGDFASAAAVDNWPEGWQKPEPGITWDRAGGFIRLISQHPGQTLMLDRKIPLKPGVRGLELAIRFRTTGVLHGQNEWFDARTIVHFLGADGKPLASEGGSLDTVFTHKPAPTGWIERTRFLIVPQGAVALELRPGLFHANAGTVDLGKVSVSVLSDREADLLQLAEAAFAISRGEENAETDRKMVARLESQLAATGNLVQNGSFQAQNPDAIAPDDWGKAPPAGESWEKDKNQRFIHLVSPNETKTLMFYKMVPLIPGLKNVDVTFRYRTDHITRGDRSPGDARAAIHFLDGTRVGHLESGKTLDPDSEPILFSSTAAHWTVITKRYAVPAGATKIQLMPGLWNARTGTLDLAEIRVSPASP